MTSAIINLEDKVKQEIEYFTDIQEPFTALQISNSLKQKGEDIRHRDISGIVRKLYSYFYIGIYESSEISVNAEIIDDDTNQLTSINTKTFLYHPLGFDLNNYDTRNLRAIKPKNLDLKIDATDTDQNATQTLNDEKFILEEDANKLFINEDNSKSYQATILKEGAILISFAKLQEMNHETNSFNFAIYPGMIFLKKAMKNGVLTTSSRGLRIRKSMLNMVELNDGVWIHMYEDKIVINNLHPIVMSWEKYKEKLISFKVETPTSNNEEDVQTVVLKVEGFKKSKDGNYLVIGKNLKRIDDKNSLDLTLRNYRFDRIFKDSVKELNF